MPPALFLGLDDPVGPSPGEPFPTHMAAPHKRATLLTCLVLCLLGACSAPGASRGAGGISLSGIPATYLPAFEGLRTSLGAGEDETARGIAAQIRRRLTIQEAPPSRVEELLAGFERVLQGRALIGGAELWLELLSRSDSHLGEVWLRGRSMHPGGIALRPGAAILEWERRTLLPDGRDSLIIRTLPLTGIKAVELGQEATVGTLLHAYDRRILPGALAVNDRWILHMVSGSVDADEAEFPAMNVAVAAAQRVELAAALPNASLGPAVLIQAAGRPDVSMPALLERTARILPRDRDAALDGLAPLVEAWTPNQIARLVPTLRWLSGVTEPGADPLAWRAWLRARAVHRAAMGTLDISDS